MNIARLLRALDFAAAKHREQRRKQAPGTTPYINHPIAVARLLAEVGGVEEEDILIAAVLHDTVEDTATTPQELEDAFGPVVRRLVEEVTDDKRLPKAQRKRLQIEHASQLSPGAALIKLADKISNVRDLAESPPADWSIERVREYITWAEAVVQNCPRVNRPLEDHFHNTLTEVRRKINQQSKP
jgi:guanosine-3',5'-bis(diphosphate) 3'-pyrophosphohydrolase